MNRLAASTLQVACALSLLCGTTPLDAQSRSDKRARAEMVRVIKDSLRAVLDASVRDSAFPGAYAIVGSSSGILAEHGTGRLDWKRSAKASRESVWDLASVTKIVATTTALAQLVDRGAVSLDAPVQRHVPAWTGDGKEAVTVRHLLTHTSGLPSFRPYDTLTHDPDSLNKLLFATALERRPGERMVYSDIGAYMMGRVIESVSGLTLDQYVARHITGPLKLRETVFRPPASWRNRIAPTEIDTLRGGHVHGKVHDERAYYLGGVAAHAGLFGSARDLARFLEMMLHRGTLDGVRILSPVAVELFTAYADSAYSNRGLGWQKPDKAGMRFKTPSAAWAGTMMSDRAFGHTGFTGTSIAVDPELDLYIILLSNRVNPTRNNPRISAVRMRLADAVVGIVRKHRSETPTAPRQE